MNSRARSLLPLPDAVEGNVDHRLAQAPGGPRDVFPVAILHLREEVEEGVEQIAASPSPRSS